jgi:hypothetical protein
VTASPGTCQASVCCSDCFARDIPFSNDLFSFFHMFIWSETNFTYSYHLFLQTFICIYIFLPLYINWWAKEFCGQKVNIMAYTWILLYSIAQSVQWRLQTEKDGIFSSSLRPDTLWGPPSLLSNGYRGFVPQVYSGKGGRLTTYLYLMHRSRMVELHLQSHLSLRGIACNYFST